MTITYLAEYRVRKVLEKELLLMDDESTRSFWQIFKGDLCVDFKKGSSFSFLGEEPKESA